MADEERTPEQLLIEAGGKPDRPESNSVAVQAISDVESGARFEPYQVDPAVQAASIEAFRRKAGLA